MLAVKLILGLMLMCDLVLGKPDDEGMYYLFFILDSLNVSNKKIGEIEVIKSAAWHMFL